VILLAGSLFAVACGTDSGVPTEQPLLKKGNLPEGSASQAKINKLINGLFQQPEKREARKRMSDIKSALSQGDVMTARDLAFEFAEFATDAYLDGRLMRPDDYATIEEALARLIELIFEFVGIEDVGAGVAQTGIGTTVAAGSGNAGVVFEDGSLTETVLVTVTRTEKYPCFPGFGRPELGGCYEFNTFPPVDQFGEPVTVVGCFDPGGWDGTEELERFVLHKYDPDDPDAEVEALPPVPASELPAEVDCEGEYLFGSTESNWLEKYAVAPLKAVGQGVATLLGPRTLHAAPYAAKPKRLGGSAGSFTDVGAALPEYTLEQGGKVWSIDPLQGSASVEDFYGYAPHSAHTGLEKSNTSLLFFYEDGDENLSLVMIHDQAGDGSGGKAVFTFDGEPTGATFIVEDDEGDGIGLPTSEWKWNNDNTDGGALGLLTGFYSIGILPSFPAEGGLTPGSISAWEFLTGIEAAPMPGPYGASPQVLYSVGADPLPGFQLIDLDFEQVFVSKNPDMPPMP